MGLVACLRLTTFHAGFVLVDVLVDSEDVAARWAARGKG